MQRHERNARAAYLIAHVLRQQRAALASIAAQRALLRDDVAEALQICARHDAREAALQERHERVLSACGDTGGWWEREVEGARPCLRRPPRTAAWCTSLVAACTT